MNTLKSPLSLLLKAPSKSFLWKLHSLDTKVGRTWFLFLMKIVIKGRRR